MTIGRLLINRIMRPSSVPEVIVEKSTPIVAFGNCRTAQVATLGINPSVAEFNGRSGLLPDNKRRLATFESLRCVDGIITEKLAQQVLLESECYFRRNPYFWFNTLTEVFLRPLGYSYFDGTAAHLDLVQSATSPIWGQLSKQQQNSLIEEDLPFLNSQLNDGRYKIIFLNGRTVIEAVQKLKLANLVEVSCIVRKSGLAKVFEGVGPGGSVFVGCSMNLQNRVTVAEKKLLTDWLLSRFSL